MAMLRQFAWDRHNGDVCAMRDSNHGPAPTSVRSRRSIAPNSVLQSIAASVIACSCARPWPAPSPRRYIYSCSQPRARIGYRTK